MGALYKKLKDLEILDDTLILFVNDHGKVDCIWSGGVLECWSVSNM